MIEDYSSGHEADVLQIPTTPVMPELAIARLKALLNRSNCYLEFGSGGSTILAAGVGVPITISIESDSIWLEAVEKAVAALRGECVLLHVDLGRTGDWGYPVSEDHWKQWYRYPFVGWELCKARRLSPDLVLIDGRFRLACFYASILFSAPGTIILFDDYTNRDHYHVAEQILPPSLFHDRMAEFVVPIIADRDAAWLALTKALTDLS